MEHPAVTEFKRRALAFDTETHLIAPGLLAPPLVCGSVAIDRDGALPSIHDPRVTRRAFRDALEGDDIIIGANIAYDLGVMAADAYRNGADGDALIAQIFAKLDRGEVYDIQIAQALDAIAKGHLFKDPVTGMGMKGRYSLDTCVQQVLGRNNAKDNDFWRTRYAILERIPMAQWPAVAVQYPKDDAANTLEVAIAQVVGRPVHAWGSDDRCTRCGVEVSFGTIPPCTGGGRPHENLQCMAAQVDAAFVLHLSAMHGFRTDPEAIAALEDGARAERAKTRPRWVAAGFLGDDTDGKDTADKHALKDRLARALGAHRPCAACAGHGRIPNAKGKGQVYCTDANIGKGARALNGATRGCDGTGLDLADAPLLARTPTGGITAGRDTLAESGDEDLMAFAEFQEDDKLFTHYLPFLKKGIDQPLNPRPNVLVESGRVSYDEVMQQIPRDMGVRECFIPREGFYFSSADYSSGELCSLAQVNLRVVGFSNMADVINATRDPGALHTAFGAKMAGASLEDFKARLKVGDPVARKFRQAAKPGNFGFPGGMGAAKFVLSKRKKNEGTTPSPYAPNGREYNGIRFCVLIGGAERCGAEMITEHRGRPCAPVCAACVKVAEDMKRDWLAQWPEMVRYFDWVNTQVEGSGRIATCPCGMVRGELGFTDGSNHSFQHLLACAAKRAAGLIAREMYVVKASPLYGSRLCAFFHDETFAEVPIWNASAASKRQAELMIEGARERFIPDVWVACEPTIMGRWSKAAEPVWRDGVVGGELLPWVGKGSS